MKYLSKLSRIIPILKWLPTYRKVDFKADLFAGIITAVMLVPQGMAYAMLAGLDPIHGLYASTLPVILYAVFASSRHLAVGPVAILSLLTAAGISSLEPVSVSEYLLYATTLALMVGIIQFGMGLLRLGFIANFLSHPVISGFTSAAAVIIGLSQIQNLFGISMPGSDRIHDIAVAVYENISQLHLPTLLLGLAGLAIIWTSRKLNRAIPGALIAVIISVLAVGLAELNNYGVEVVGNVPSGLPQFESPSWELKHWLKLIPIALTISLIGFAESYAIAKTVQSRRKNYQLDSNQELIGLGLANLGAAFLKGFPVTGGFSRTAINDQAGARTSMSSIICALLIVFTLLFLTPLFYYLPTTILAAVIIVAVMGLINIREPVRLWKKDKADFALLMATFVTTLFGGIELGIIAGFALSITLVIYSASRPHMAKLGRIPGTSIFRNTDRFEGLEVWRDTLIVRIDGPMYFANLDFIKKNIDRWVEENPTNLKKIILSAHTITSLDSTAAHSLTDWIIEWERLGFEVYISGPIGPVRDVLEKWQIIDLIGIENVFISNEQAVLMLDGKIDKGEKKSLDKYALQSNVEEEEE